MADPIFWDGAERQDLLKWSIVNATPAIDTVTVRKDADGNGGSASFKLEYFPAGGHSQMKAVFVRSSAEGGDEYGTVFIGFGFRFSNTQTQEYVIAKLYSGGGQYVEGEVRLGTNGALRIYVATGSSGNLELQATSSNQLTVATWYWLEIKYVLASSNGIMEVRVDEVVWVTFTGDTQGNHGMNPSVTRNGIDTVRFDAVGSTMSQSAWVDDVVVRTDRYPGSQFIVAATVNADGAVGNGIVGSDGDSINNYQLIDEIPHVASDYVEADTAAEEQTYAAVAPAGLPTNASVEFVGITTTALRQGAGLTKLQFNFRRGGVSYYYPDDSTQVLAPIDIPVPTARGPVSAAKEKDPSGNVAWTRANAVAVEPGFKAVA